MVGDFSHGSWVVIHLLSLWFKWYFLPTLQCRNGGRTKKKKRLHVLFIVQYKVKTNKQTKKASILKKKKQGKQILIITS